MLLSAESPTSLHFNTNEYPVLSAWGCWSLSWGCCFLNSLRRRYLLAPCKWFYWTFNASVSISWTTYHSWDTLRDNFPFLISLFGHISLASSWCGHHHSSVQMVIWGVAFPVPMSPSVLHHQCGPEGVKDRRREPILFSMRYGTSLTSLLFMEFLSAEPAFWWTAQRIGAVFLSGHGQSFLIKGPQVLILCQSNFANPSLWTKSHHFVYKGKGPVKRTIWYLPSRNLIL